MILVCNKTGSASSQQHPRADADESEVGVRVEQRRGPLGAHPNRIAPSELLRFLTLSFWNVDP